MCGHLMHENREIPCVPAVEGRLGRLEKAIDRTSGMHAQGKSDKLIVPMRSSNKGGHTARMRRGRREGA